MRAKKARLGELEIVEVERLGGILQTAWDSTDQEAIFNATRRTSSKIASTTTGMLN
jgi:hypothetical protein